MSSIDIREEIDAFKRRSPGPRREKVRSRIIDAGAKLEARASRMGAFPDGLLEKAWDKVPADEWIDKLHEYEAMCDAVAAIETEVLSA